MDVFYPTCSTDVSVTFRAHLEAPFWALLQSHFSFTLCLALLRMLFRSLNSCYVLLRVLMPLPLYVICASVTVFVRALHSSSLHAFGCLPNFGISILPFQVHKLTLHLFHKLTLNKCHYWIYGCLIRSHPRHHIGCLDRRSPPV